MGLPGLAGRRTFWTSLWLRTLTTGGCRDGDLVIIPVLSGLPCLPGWSKAQTGYLSAAIVIQYLIYYEEVSFPFIGEVGKCSFNSP